jgi:hypothetical protein
VRALLPLVLTLLPGCWRAVDILPPGQVLRDPDAVLDFEACAPVFDGPRTLSTSTVGFTSALDIEWTGRAWLVAFDEAVADGPWGARVLTDGRVEPIPAARGALLRMAADPASGAVVAGGTAGLFLLDPFGEVRAGPFLRSPPEVGWAFAMEPIVAPAGIGVAAAVRGFLETAAPPSPEGVFHWHGAPGDAPPIMPTPAAFAPVEDGVPVFAVATGEDGYTRFVVSEDDDTLVLDVQPDGGLVEARATPFVPFRLLAGAVALREGDFVIHSDFPEDAWLLRWVNARTGEEAPLAALERDLAGVPAIEGFPGGALVAGRFADRDGLEVRLYPAASDRPSGAPIVLESGGRPARARLARSACGFGVAWMVADAVAMQAFECCLP